MMLQWFLTDKAQTGVKALLPDYADGELAAVCSWADEFRDLMPWSAELHYVNQPDFSCNYNYSSKLSYYLLQRCSFIKRDPNYKMLINIIIATCLQQKMTYQMLLVLSFSAYVIEIMHYIRGPELRLSYCLLQLYLASHIIYLFIIRKSFEEL